MTTDYPDANKIPLLTKENLINYRDKGIPPGDFVRALLENNLLESFLRADDNNRSYLQHTVAWLYWEMPSNLWKCKENINNHLTYWAEKRKAYKPNLELAQAMAKDLDFTNE